MGLAAAASSGRARSSSCATSRGSMERHSRLLLRFVQALSGLVAVQTESFVFGTRLTRVTRLLRDRDRDRALAGSPTPSTTGPAGRGSASRSASSTSAGRAGRSGRAASSIVVSDGWDRGDPALVAAETARLRRNCHRLVWLNPLAGDARLPAARRRDAGRVCRTSTTSCRPGTLASLERLGEILRRRPRRAADARGGGEAAAAPTRRPSRPARAAPRARRRTRLDAGAAARWRRTGRPRPIRPGHVPADPSDGRPGRWTVAMKELLETLDGWRRDGRRRRAGGRGPDVRLGAATGGRRPAARGRRADRRLGQRRLRRGRRGRGDRAGPRATATAGSSATGSATRRRGTSGSPAAARSTCSSSRRARRRSRRRRTRPRASADRRRRCRPTRRRPEFGPHAAGRRRADRGRPIVVTTDGAPRGLARRRRRRRGARRRRPRCARARDVADGRARRPVAVRRGVPGPAAAGRRRGGPGRDPARRASPASSGYETVVVDGRRGLRDAASAFPPTSTGWSSAGRTRSPMRSASGRTTRSPS